MNKKKLPKRMGFTLMEALVTTIVLVGLMSIALPQYFTLMQKLKNQEAKAILLSLYGEQKKCLSEGALCPNLSQMDIEVPAPKNFNPIPAGALHGAVTCSGDTVVYFGSLTSSDGSYTLYVLSDGSIACTPCPSTKCQTLGFGDFSGVPSACPASVICAADQVCVPPDSCIAAP